MLEMIVVAIGAGLVILTLWYLVFQGYNRRRCAEIQEWIKTAFAGHAQILGVQWLTSSTFHVHLRLVPSIFARAHIAVQLLPRETPLSWMLSRIRKQNDTLTFEADFDVPPGFNLEVHNQRWCEQSRRQLDAKRAVFEHCGPFVLTTRTDWQREITSMMDALVASRDSDFLSVCFRRTSPHLSASVPIGSLADCAGNDIFGVLRELADCASASRF